MSKKFKYETCCVESNADDIAAMVDRAVSVSYDELRKNCQGLLAWEKSHGYIRTKGRGVQLKYDWHVHFYKSLFRGKPCYFIDHSCIEHIWVAT